MNDQEQDGAAKKRAETLRIYAALKGMERTWPSSASTALILQRASQLIRQGCDLLNLEPSEYLPPSNLIYSSGGSDHYFNPAEARPFIQQFISHLEMVEQAGERIQDVGSLFNVIKHDELKKRCSDLLSSPGPFDRAINQATLVFEDTLRK